MMEYADICFGEVNYKKYLLLITSYRFTQTMFTIVMFSATSCIFSYAQTAKMFDVAATIIAEFMITTKVSVRNNKQLYYMPIMN